MPRKSLWLAMPVAMLLATSPRRLQAGRDRGGQAELQAPAGDRPVKIDLAGDTVLPNGPLSIVTRHPRESGTAPVRNGAKP